LLPSLHGFLGEFLHNGDKINLGNFDFLVVLSGIFFKEKILEKKKKKKNMEISGRYQCLLPY
jgi:hypothetical protein